MTAVNTLIHADAILNVLKGTTYTGLAGLFVKLHIGDPGNAGTANAAGKTTRKTVALDATTGTGSTQNTSDIVWTSVSTSETYSHLSLWSAVTAGVCVMVGALTTPKAVTAGDNAQFSAGSLVVSEVG